MKSASMLEQPRARPNIDDNGNNYGGSSALSVLVVDDEPDTTRVIKMGLEKEGFEVDIYNDPEEALKLFSADTYDFLLLDVKMPKMDGIELYEKLRKMDDIARVYFVTATDRYSNLVNERYPNWNGNCIIVKPVSTRTIASLLRKDYLQGIPFVPY